MNVVINAALLTALTTAFKTIFNGALGQAKSMYTTIATVVPSTTKQNTYAWLGKLPNMREWLGDRVIHGLSAHGYTITNKSFELTVGVDRDDIEDDQYGVYNPMFEELGRSAAAHPDQLVFSALANGHASLCYDGQNFFDTDHPVLDENGAVQSQSNLDDNSGSGTRWYLLDTSRAIKPIIFQSRKKPEFVSKTALTDDNVFTAKQFVYGVDYRGNVGYGLWQLAYCSRKDLDETNLVAAWTAMRERKGDQGRPLGVRPNILLVPPGKYVAALKLANADKLANGADNVLKGLVQVVEADWLA